jgi:hypothetical protein
MKIKRPNFPFKFPYKKAASKNNVIKNSNMQIGNFVQVNVGECNFQVPVRYQIEHIIGGGSYGIVM